MRIATNKRKTYFCLGKNKVEYLIEGISEDYNYLYLRRTELGFGGVRNLYRLNLKGRLGYHQLVNVPYDINMESEIKPQDIKKHLETFPEFKSKEAFLEWFKSEFSTHATRTYVDEKMIGEKVNFYIRKSQPLMNQLIVDLLATILPQDANLENVVKGLNRRMDETMKLKLIRDYLDADTLVVMIDGQEKTLYDLVIHLSKV